jgi:hypothetical protein
MARARGRRHFFEPDVAEIPVEAVAGAGWRRAEARAIDEKRVEVAVVVVVDAAPVPLASTM